MKYKIGDKVEVLYHDKSECIGQTGKITTTDINIAGSPEYEIEIDQITIWCFEHELKLVDLNLERLKQLQYDFKERLNNWSNEDLTYSDFYNKISKEQLFLQI